MQTTLLYEPGRTVTSRPIMSLTVIGSGSGSGVGSAEGSGSSEGSGAGSAVGAAVGS